MVHVVELTRKQKIKMYKKLKKREIIEMLLTNQELVAGLIAQQTPHMDSASTNEFRLPDGQPYTPTQ